MTSIETSKIFLKENGYTSFNLKDFNEEYYNLLLPFKCNEDTNLKREIKGVRATYLKNSVNNDSHTTFNEAKLEKEKIVQEMNDTGMTPEKLGFHQIYYQYHFGRVFENITRQPFDDNPFYKKIISDIVRYYFDIDESVELLLPSTYLTYYDKDCVLANHSDGTGTGRVCSLLIYLNETYDENDGGILFLQKNYSVLPVFGNVALIDLQSHDIQHQVTKVTGGIGRYAILSFVKTKENEFIHSHRDREKNLM